MHIFKHHKDGEHAPTDKPIVDHVEEGQTQKEHQTTDKSHQKKHHYFHHQKEERDKDLPPKGFYNDAMRTSSKPDTLYGFDDPTARRLGPVPSEDPTNTGA